MDMRDMSNGLHHKVTSVARVTIGCARAVPETRKSHIGYPSRDDHERVG
jgi:hypothetical protein